MKKINIAAIIMIIHGALIEILGSLLLIPLLLNNVNMNNNMSFIIPYFNEHMYLMITVSILFGILRIISSIALLKNKMWGLILSIIICIITLVLMIFLLPAGIIDGILSSVSLILILIGYYGNKKII